MRREIVAFGSYYKDFMATLHDKERRKVLYVLSLLEREDRLPTKFIKHLLRGLYELRIKYESNIYRIFFYFRQQSNCCIVQWFPKENPENAKNRNRQSN